MLRETKFLRERAANLPEQTERLEGFVLKLSEPAIVGQLLQSLDEGSHIDVDTHAAEVLRELRATALEPLVSWIPNLSSEPLRNWRRKSSIGWPTLIRPKCSASSRFPILPPSWVW